MTCGTNTTIYDDLLEHLQREGTSGLGQVVQIRLNEAMKLERTRHLKASLYERTDNRRGYSNGFKNKRLRTKVDKATPAPNPVEAALRNAGKKCVINQATLPAQSIDNSCCARAQGFE